MSEKISSDSYQTLLQHLPLGIVIWELTEANNVESFQLIEANKEGEEITQLSNFSVKERIGLKIRKAFPKLFETEVPQQFLKALNNQKAQKLPNLTYGDPALKIPANTFSIYAIPLNEKLLAIVFKNITQETNSEEQIQKQIKEMEKLNQLMTGRELKMIELKQEIQRLKNEKKR